MKTIQFYADTNRSDNLLHIETDGCIVNIHVGLTDNQGRKVTAIRISPEDESRSPDLDGYYWHLEDGCRVVRQRKPIRWESADHRDEPRDQTADAHVVEHGYWSLGPNDDGNWFSVTLVEQRADDLQVISETSLGSFPSEDAAKAAAQAIEDKGHL